MPKQCSLSREQLYPYAEMQILKKYNVVKRLMENESRTKT